MNAPPTSWSAPGSWSSSSHAKMTAATTSVSATNDARRDPSRRLAAMPVVYAIAAVTTPRPTNGSHQATLSPP